MAKKRIEYIAGVETYKGASFLYIGRIIERSGSASSEYEGIIQDGYRGITSSCTI